jgi:mannose-6-phosphate isomerase
VPWVDKESFPLLVKLIDAKSDLSIQVHPSAECAALHEGDSEKTEMWYVIDCDEGAELILGFNEEFEKERKRDRDKAVGLVKKHIEEGTVTDVCRAVPVHRGDVFFVEPGTLHAICRGIFLAEVQQNSDTTYRVYDYGRLGADGRPRELHIDRALDALRLAPTESARRTDKTAKTDFGSVRRLELGAVKTEVVSLDGKFERSAAECALHLLVLSGAAALEWEGGVLPVSKGDSVYVPSGLAFFLEGKCEALLSRIE